LRNPNLADTFQKIASDGAGVFYHGEIAKRIALEIQQQKGLLSIEDLNNYRAYIKNPVRGSYRQYEILTAPPPAGGGTHLIELLNILEGYNLSDLEHNSADYLHLLAEAMKICLADKEVNMADPDFYQVAVDKLTDKKYAMDLHRYIKPNTANFNYKPAQMTIRESGSTTHLSVVDHQGNMVALTQSINYWFGSGITVAGTGILLNNHLADFAALSGLPNSIEPKKRPVSNMAPTILLKDGRPFITIGTPGGSRIIGALAQIILNIIEFHMNIDEAIEAPRIHAYKNTLHLEGRFSGTIVDALKKKGHTIKLHQNYDNYFGGAQGILIDLQTGILHGGADSRRDGAALGY
jgi:gamma-glutamyltranspeptidase/glutathione hydrolase